MNIRIGCTDMARKAVPGDPASAANHAPQVIPSGPKINRNAMMPGHRVRHDGWTQERTQRFFDALAFTGCVRDAARVAGVSNVAAYRMKRKYPAFAAAFDAALGRAHVGLIALAYKRALEGNETVVIRKGEEYERRITPSDAMLSLLIKRGDMGGGVGKSMGAGNEVLTLDEWRAHRRFGRDGEKITVTDPIISQQDFRARIAQLRGRLAAQAAAGGACPYCAQTLPDRWPQHSLAGLVALGVVDLAELK
jgi:hypothetical protein